MDLIFILLTQLINLTPSTLTFQAGDGGGPLLPELPPGKTRCAKPSRVLRRLNEPDPGGWKFRVMLDGRFTGIELDPRAILRYVRLVFRVEGDVLCVAGVHEKRSDVLFRHRYFGWMRNYYWDRRLVESIHRSDSKLATKLRDLEGQSQHLEIRYASPPKESPKKNKQDELKGPPQPRPKSDHRPLGPSRGNTSIDDSENDTKSTQPKNTTTAKWQVGPREIARHFAPPVKSGEEIGLNDKENKINIPRPQEPMDIGGNGTEPQQSYGPPPAQRVRPTDDESSTNVVEKDSFVHGMLLMFALIVFIWIKFLL